jgi:hypothetical protein
MIIAISFVAGIFIAWLAGSCLFSDFRDLLVGCGRLVSFLFGYRYTCRSDRMLSDWQDDDNWIPASIRFLLVLALSIGSGYMTYRGLHALFG